MNNQRDEFMDDMDQIDIIALLKDVWKYKFFVVGVMLIFMLVIGVKMVYFTPYTYTADSVLYVSNRTSKTDDTKYVNKNDIDTARTMSETYMETLKTRDFLMEVSNTTGGKYSWGQIKKMMSVNAVNETELLSMKVTATSPEDAYKIANAIITLAPQKLSSVCEGGSISIIDKAVFPSSPNGKGTVKKVAMGAMAGAILAVIIIFLWGFFDTKVHKSEDVARKYDISILGELYL